MINNRCALMFFMIVFCLQGTAWSKEYLFKNDKKNLIVSYQVSEGYKTTINISRDSMIVFNTYFEADYDGAPKVDFVDLNGDGEEDVIIKLTSEGEYSPYILINNKKSFINALSNFAHMIFSYDVYNKSLYETGQPNKSPEYWLADVNGDGIQELIFENLIIDGEIERNVVLYLDDSKKKYSRSIHRKTTGKGTESDQAK